MRQIILFWVFLGQIYASGWTLVGDTFTDKSGTCEFDIWLRLEKSENLGFYADCVVFKGLSLQVANNASTHSFGDKAFFEIEQEFYTNKEETFNFGMIFGDAFGTNENNGGVFKSNQPYFYIPIAWRFFNQKLQTTINIGYSTNFIQDFLILSGSLNFNPIPWLNIISEISTSSNHQGFAITNASFWQIGAIFFIKDNISLDFAYLNDLDISTSGTFIFSITFKSQIF